MVSWEVCCLHVYCTSHLTTHLQYGQPELPTTFWLIPTVPPKRDIWMLQFCNQNIQTAVSSTCQNCSINPPYFRLQYLPVWNALCFIYSNPKWVFFCTHEVCRWSFHSLQGRFWPTQNVLTSISVRTVTHKECFLNDKPMKRSNLILKWWNHWIELGTLWVSIKFSSSAHNEWNFLKFVTSHNILLNKFLYFCQFCHPQRKLLEISLWSKTTWSYSSWISGMVLLTPECEIKTTAMSELHTKIKHNYTVHA